MRYLLLVVSIFLIAGCNNEKLTWISIKNGTDIPIHALPYSEDYTNGDWIQPGLSGEFYSINCDCLDAFSYFSYYYDSLIVFLQDHDEDPIKFYKDGTTINYDSGLNPFTNQEVWQIEEFEKQVSSSTFNTLKDKQIIEYYFTVDAGSVKSIDLFE